MFSPVTKVAPRILTENYLADWHFWSTERVFKGPCDSFDGLPNDQTLRR